MDRGELEYRDDGTVGIPLLAQDGTIQAFAIIDADDAPWVSQWAWRLSALGYATRGTRINGVMRRIRLHREILGLVHGDALQGDHINHNRLDNRKSNLRIVTDAQNRQNVTGLPGASSKYRGVYWSKRAKKWVATIKTQGKQKYLGAFTNETEAAEVARLARQLLLPWATD